MNVLFRKTVPVNKFRTLLKNTPFKRTAIYLDHEWMPGPYPRNEEERRAAAKKYNLLPEEYEPMDPKWDCGTGDYPMLPNISFDQKFPYGDYEFMSEYGNAGEPIHHAWDALDCTGMDMNYDSHLLTFGDAVLLTAAMCAISYWHMKFIRHFRRIKEYKPLHKPFEGVHYHYPTSDLHCY